MTRTLVGQHDDLLLDLFRGYRAFADRGCEQSAGRVQAPDDFLGKATEVRVQGAPDSVNVLPNPKPASQPHTAHVLNDQRVHLRVIEKQVQHVAG